MRLGQVLRYWGSGVGTRAAQNGKIKVTIDRKLSYPAPDDGDTCVESCPSNETPEILSPNNDRRWWIEVTNSAPQCCQGGLICQHTPAAILPLTFCSATITLGLNLVIWHSILVKNRHFQHRFWSIAFLIFPGRLAGAEDGGEVQWIVCSCEHVTAPPGHWTVPTVSLQMRREGEETRN